MSQEDSLETCTAAAAASADGDADEPVSAARGPIPVIPATTLALKQLADSWVGQEPNVKEFIRDICKANEMGAVPHAYHSSSSSSSSIQVSLHTLLCKVCGADPDNLPKTSNGSVPTRETIGRAIKLVFCEGKLVTVRTRSLQDAVKGAIPNHFKQVGKQPHAAEHLVGVVADGACLDECSL